MTWLVVLAIAAALVVGFFAWSIWVGGGRNIGRDRFPDTVRRFLLLFENGAFVRFDDRGSDFWFSFERLDGSDIRATLSLRIPRQDVTLAVANDLRSAYDAHGFEWTEEMGNPSLLAKVLIPVEDIWDKTSGAKGAHAARLLLEIVGLPPNSRFNVRQGGHASKRWKMRHISALRG